MRPSAGFTAACTFSSVDVDDVLTVGSNDDSALGPELLETTLNSQRAEASSLSQHERATLRCIFTQQSKSTVWKLCLRPSHHPRTIGALQVWGYRRRTPAMPWALFSSTFRTRSLHASPQGLEQMLCWQDAKLHISSSTDRPRDSRVAPRSVGSLASPRRREGTGCLRNSQTCRPPRLGTEQVLNLPIPARRPPWHASHPQQSLSPLCTREVCG